MSTYSPIVHKHQFTDVDQTWPIKGLGSRKFGAGYDSTNRFLVSSSLLTLNNYWGWLEGSVHPNYIFFFFVSITVPSHAEVLVGTIFYQRNCLESDYCEIPRLTRTLTGKTRCCWLFQCHFSFSGLSSTIIWVCWPIKSTDERNCCCTEFIPVQYI